jgi:hypothetical protein
MRSVALIAALACATVAHAEGVRESRYGPERERAPTPMSGSPAYGAQPYVGRTLGWSGKRADVAPAAPQATAQPAARQQPWWSLPIGAPPQAQAPVPQQAARAPIPQPWVQQAPARALPQTIHDAPAPAPQSPQAYAQAPYAPPAAAPRALLPGQTTARTYSVGREFGLQPDPIPAAGPSRMVLVGPPATAPDDDEPTSRGDKKDDTQ